MSKFTKGPWTFDAETVGIWGDPTALFPIGDGTTAQGVQVASLDTAGNGVWVDEEEYFANARLIAAAPTMAEALKAVVFQMQANRPPSECMALALEMAQKALGAAGIICGDCPLCRRPMDREGNLCSSCAMEEL